MPRLTTAPSLNFVYFFQCDEIISLIFTTILYRARTGFSLCSFPTQGKFCFHYKVPRLWIQVFSYEKNNTVETLFSLQWWVCSVPDDCLIVWQLHDDCMTTAWLLAYLDFHGFDFRNFQFPGVDNSILFSSSLVLLTNLDLRGFRFRGLFCVSPH